MNLKKFSRLIVVVLSIISIVFLATIMAADAKDGGMIEPFIYVAYLTLLIAIVLVLVYTVKNLATKDLKKTFISIGAFLAVILIAFIVADGTPVPLKDGGEVSSFGSKMVSTGLNAFYLLAVVALGLMFLSGYKRIKK